MFRDDVRIKGRSVHENFVIGVGTGFSVGENVPRATPFFVLAITYEP